MVDPPIASVVDQRGRQVVQLTRIWEGEIVRGQPELAGYLGAVTATIAHPDHVEPDNTPGPREALPPRAGSEPMAARARKL
jgi:hypothetical protein